MEVTGKVIIDLGETSGVSKAGNTWKKHEWVLETTGTQYPRKVKFHFFGARADENNLVIGNDYTIQYDIDSREFNGRWYTDIAAYSSRPAVAEAPAQDGYQAQPGGYAAAPAAPAAPASPFGAAPAFDAAAPAFPEPAGSDDLPF